MNEGYEIAKSRIQEVIEKQKAMTEASEGEAAEVEVGDDFPPETLSLKGLELQSIPKEIVSIQNLVGLDLSDNELETIPEWFKNIATVRLIDLRNNKISRLPEWLSIMHSAKRVRHMEEPIAEFGYDGFQEGLFLYGNPLEVEFRPLKIFISYSHKNSDEMREWASWLEGWRKTANIDLDFWHDKEILAGDNWFEKIQTKLLDSNTVFFLISKDFLTSDFIKAHEMNPILKRLKEADNVLAISIMLRLCTSLFEDSELAKFQVIPSIEKPISKYRDKEEAWNITLHSAKKSIKSKFKWL